MEGVDWGAYYQFHDARPRLAALTTLLRAAAPLGGYPVLGLVLLAAVFLLAARRRPRTALFLLALVAGSALLAQLLKFVVPRERPPDWDGGGTLLQIPAAADLSFPSAGALVSVVTYGALAVLLARAARRRGARLLALAGAVVLVLLIGTSQLFLGAHFLSDVLAGWAAGLAVLLAGCALALPDAEPRV